MRGREGGAQLVRVVRGKSHAMRRITVDHDVLDIDLGQASKPGIFDLHVEDLAGWIRAAQLGTERPVSEIRELNRRHLGQVVGKGATSIKIRVKHF